MVNSSQFPTPDLALALLSIANHSLSLPLLGEQLLKPRYHPFQFAASDLLWICDTG